MSHGGNAWVYVNAQVFDRAHVYGRAQVYDNAHVYGMAHVYGNAMISGNAVVRGNALVYGDAWVCGGVWRKSPCYIQGTRWAVHPSSPETIRCGCQNHTWKEWHDRYKEISARYGGDDVLEEYILYFNLLCDIYGHKECKIGGNDGTTDRAI